MAKQPRVRVLNRYVERSIALGLGLLAPGLAALVWAAFAPGPFGVVLASIGSTLLTVAILSLLYEPFLRDILVAEILAKVGLRDSLVRAGLQDIFRVNEANLPDLLGTSANITVLPLSPLEWSTASYQSVVGHATTYQTIVRIFLPSPDGPGLEVLAERLDMSAEELTRKLRLLPDSLAEAWDSKPRHDNSRLEVLSFTGVPAIGILTCEACAIYEVGPSIGYWATDRSSTLLVHNTDSPAAAWMTEQLRFTGRPEPVLAAVRPLGSSTPGGGRAPEVDRGSTSQTNYPLDPSQRAPASDKALDLDRDAPEPEEAADEEKA